MQRLHLAFLFGSAAVLVPATRAAAAPVTVDSVLCERIDARSAEDGPHTYLSVAHARPGATVRIDKAEDADQGKVTVCRDGGACTTFTTTRFSSDGRSVNDDGSLLLVGSDKGLIVERADTGAKVKTIKSKRGHDYQCGGGLFLGATILARGGDCQEYDARPYLARANGTYLAPLVSKTFEGTEDTLYDAAHLDGALWAIAVHDDNHEDKKAGTVYVLDTTTGKVRATATGAPGGKVTVTEGKGARTIDQLPACAP